MQISSGENTDHIQSTIFKFVFNLSVCMNRSAYCLHISGASVTTLHKVSTVYFSPVANL